MKLERVVAATAAGIVASAIVFSFPQARIQDPVRTVADGVYAQAQADRGQALYDQRCAACHGVGLEGADVNPPLAGPGFLANWHGRNLRELTTRTRTTMPLDDPGGLSASETTDIIAYLLQRNDFPAGDSELSPASRAQQAIRIGGG